MSPAVAVATLAEYHARAAAVRAAARLEWRRVARLDLDEAYHDLEATCATWDAAKAARAVVELGEMINRERDRCAVVVRVAA